MSVVIGVGNPWRGDDGVGHHVVEAVRASLPPSVGVQLLDGEPTRLLDADGKDQVVVVDAVKSGEPPGTVRSWEVDEHAVPSPVRTEASSHGGGVAEATRLGHALDRLPDRLVVVTVEVGSVDDGKGLSPAVEAAVSEACERVAGR